MDEVPIWKIGEAPAGLRHIEFRGPPVYEATAPFKIYIGDCLIIADGVVKPSPNFIDMNAVAGSSAGVGERFYWTAWPEELPASVTAKPETDPPGPMAES